MDFSKKTLVELREIAKEKGLKGITALRKPELIQRLTEVSEETKREPEVMPERTMERKPVSQRTPMERQTRPVRQDRMERNDRQDRYERRPSPEELDDELEIPVDKISDTLKVSGRHISVDAPFVEGEDNSLLDVLVNDDSPMADRSLVNESLAREIDRALSTLTDREKEIIQMFFGIGQQEMTLEEIGDKFGLTRERVRQIKEKAIRRLRQSNRSKLLKSYLG